MKKLAANCSEVGRQLGGQGSACAEERQQRSLQGRAWSAPVALLLTLAQRLGKLEAKARWILEKLEFHYTAIHANWLNMAEIEISVMNRLCLDRRIKDVGLLAFCSQLTDTGLPRPRARSRSCTHANHVSDGKP
jgi:hypothetical protein